MKVSKEKWAEAELMLKAGATQKSIAEHLGVSAARVCQRFKGLKKSEAAEVNYLAETETE